MPQLSLHTPIGDVTVSEEDGAIVALDWGWGRDQMGTALLAEARHPAARLFRWRPVALRPAARPRWHAVPAARLGGAPQHSLWRDADAEIARIAGGSARSAGQASGANPVPIIIPCHRVLASGGLGGYSGGDGLETKRALLAIETRAAQPLSTAALPLWVAAG